MKSHTTSRGLVFGSNVFYWEERLWFGEAPGFHTGGGEVEWDVEPGFHTGGGEVEWDVEPGFRTGRGEVEWDVEHVPDTTRQYIYI